MRRTTFLALLALVGSILLAAPAHAGLTVSIKDPEECFYEADAPGAKFRFKVVLSAPPAKTVKVDFETEEAVAKAGEDFTNVTGTLTFDPGDKSETVKVPVIDDKRNEQNFEKLLVKLSNARGASIEDGKAAGWICNDDEYPMLELHEPYNVTEGDTAQVEVSLTEESGRRVELSYQTYDVSQATPGEDFEPTSGILVWQPGQKNKTVQIPTYDNVDDPEQDETLQLFFGYPLKNIGSPMQSSWSTDVTIVNDDAST